MSRTKYDQIGCFRNTCIDHIDQVEKNEYIRQSWLFFIDKLLLPTKITSAGIVCSHNSWLASLPQGLFGVLPPGRELLCLLSIKLHLASLWLLTLLTLCCINDVLWVSLKLKQQARNLFRISFQSHSFKCKLCKPINF